MQQKDANSVVDNTERCNQSTTTSWKSWQTCLFKPDGQMHRASVASVLMCNASDSGKHGIHSFGSDGSHSSGDYGSYSSGDYGSYSSNGYGTYSSSGYNGYINGSHGDCSSGDRLFSRNAMAVARRLAVTLKIIIIIIITIIVVTVDGNAPGESCLAVDKGGKARARSSRPGTMTWCSVRGWAWSCTTCWPMSITIRLWAL